MNWSTLLLDVFEIQPFVTLPVDLRKKLVVVAVHPAALGWPAIMCAAGELTPVKACNIGLGRGQLA